MFQWAPWSHHHPTIAGCHSLLDAALHVPALDSILDRTGGSARYFSQEGTNLRSNMSHPNPEKNGLRTPAPFTCHANQPPQTAMVGTEQPSLSTTIALQEKTEEGTKQQGLSFTW